MPNPKVTPDDNTEKDPENWVTGDGPMTGAQASHLKTLSEQAHQPEAVEEGLTKAEASERIDQLKKHAKPSSSLRSLETERESRGQLR